MGELQDLVNRLESVEGGSYWPAPSEPMLVARRIVEARQRDDVTLLRHWRGDWMESNNGAWFAAEDAAVRSMLYSTLENVNYFNKAGPKPWAPTRCKIADVVDALSAVTHLSETVHPPEWIGSTEGPPARELVVARNGILHVTARTLIDHDPNLFNTVRVPFDYDPDTPGPTRWLTFLNQLWPDDPESIAALQEWIGYVLSGRTDLHKILLLVGPTRAGKGVLARVLGALVGRANVAGPTLASLGTNFGLQPLIGKPLAIISDARLGNARGVNQIVERLLSISGEDWLTIDRKYKEPWSGKLNARFVIISNELPRFGDASGAIANRFVLLTLRRSWLGEENTRLTDELLTELPGILVWALDGLDHLNRKGSFTEPTASKEAILALQDLISPVSAFVRDWCVVGPQHEITTERCLAGPGHASDHKPAQPERAARLTLCVYVSTRSATTISSPPAVIHAQPAPASTATPMVSATNPAVSRITGNADRSRGRERLQRCPTDRPTCATRRVISRVARKPCSAATPSPQASSGVSLRLSLRLSLLFQLS